MKKLDIVGIKQIEIIDDSKGGAVLLAVIANGADIEIHFTLPALVALEAVLAAGTEEQAKRHVVQ